MPHLISAFMHSCKEASMGRPKPFDIVALLQPILPESLQLTDECYDLSAGLAAGTVGPGLCLLIITAGGFRGNLQDKVGSFGFLPEPIEGAIALGSAAHDEDIWRYYGCKVPQEKRNVHARVYMR